MALAGSACSPEPKTPKRLCGGLVPGWAVTEATGTHEIKDRLRERDFDGDLVVSCSIVFEDARGLAYDLGISLSTVRFELNRLRFDEKPVVEGGQPVRIGIGRGTISAKEAWIYTTCDGTEYVANVTVTGKAPGSRKAVRAIAASLLDALAKHHDCTDSPTASPSPKAG